ncbi:MAG: tRNA (adenosine(37)-N6)-threonylcarbamoyltransferase complex dimerization subunit type 1 TsaB [Thermoleophilia bacterium]
MILALEAAGSSCSAALFDAAGWLRRERLYNGGRAHTQVLLAAVHEVVSAVEAAADIDCVVVGRGPGAYTGMRIGIATARALAQAAGEQPTRLIGVPSLAALALALLQADADATVAAPLIDGRRGEVFAAVYGRGPGAADAGLSASMHVLAGLAVLPRAKIGDYLAKWPGAVTGGDGAHLYAADVPTAVRLSPTVTASTASAVGHAYLAGVPGVVEGLARVLPLYGREPDAVRWSGSHPPIEAS